MEISTQIVLSLTAYKIASLVVGGIFAYMGYRLFMSGIWGHAGELESAFGNNKLVLKNAAPGTFFALFGAVIISVTIYKGLEYEKLGDKVQSEPYVEITEDKHNDLPQKPPF